MTRYPIDGDRPARRVTLLGLSTTGTAYLRSGLDTLAPDQGGAGGRVNCVSLVQRWSA